MTLLSLLLRRVQRSSPKDRTVAKVAKVISQGNAGRKDGFVHISSVLGSALSQVRPRSPRFAKLIIAPVSFFFSFFDTENF